MDRRTVVIIAAVAAALIRPGWAAPELIRPDHDAALAAVARGEAKPLDEILGLLAAETGDKLVDVALDRTDDRWIYDLTLLTPEGRYRMVTVDAATAAILNEELK